MQPQYFDSDMHICMCTRVGLMHEQCILSRCACASGPAVPARFLYLLPEQAICLCSVTFELSSLRLCCRACSASMAHWSAA